MSVDQNNILGLTSAMMAADERKITDALMSPHGISNAKEGRLEALIADIVKIADPAKREAAFDALIELRAEELRQSDIITKAFTDATSDTISDGDSSQTGQDPAPSLRQTIAQFDQIAGLTPEIAQLAVATVKSVTKLFVTSTPDATVAKDTSAQMNNTIADNQNALNRDPNENARDDNTRNQMEMQTRRSLTRSELEADKKKFDDIKKQALADMELGINNTNPLLAYADTLAMLKLNMDGASKEQIKAAAKNPKEAVVGQLNNTAGNRELAVQVADNTPAGTGLGSLGGLSPLSVPGNMGKQQQSAGFSRATLPSRNTPS